MTPTDPNPAYPPLTQLEFEAGAAGKWNDVAVIENEYGYVYAYGHIDPAQMVEATHGHDREMTGDPYVDRHEVSEVRHKWAVALVASPEWYIEWNHSEDEPGVFPLTVIQR